MGIPKPGKVLSIIETEPSFWKDWYYSTDFIKDLPSVRHKSIVLIIKNI